MLVKKRRLILLVAVIISISTIAFKITQGLSQNYEVVSDAGLNFLPNGFLLFYPDEITYITWLEKRGGALQEVLEGKREATNLFGYAVSWFYNMTGKWYAVFAFGFLGLYLFYHTTIRFFRAIGGSPKASDAVLAIVCLSPVVLMLSASVLRELYILAVINMCFVFSLKRHIKGLLVGIIFLFLLRNFYIVILMPAFVYFWFYYQQNRAKWCFFAGVASLLVIATVIFLKNSLYITSPVDILFRFVSAFTGVNVAVVRFWEISNENFAFAIERVSLIYQAAVMFLFYGYICVRKFKLNQFIWVFIFAAASLSLLYGYFLGYFVARTKLILLWLVCVYFLLDRTELENKKNRD